MTIARRYELHNEKVIKYFTSKYRQFVDDYLLVIDLQNDENPWQQIMQFLHYHKTTEQDLTLTKPTTRTSNNSDHDIINQCPNVNKAPDDQVSNMIPKDMKFDWKNYQFQGKKQKVFDIAQKYYRQPYSMEYNYFESYHDPNFVNLFEDLYNVNPPSS